MLDVSKPSTVYIAFSGNLPRYFELRNSAGELYHFRHLDGKTPRIKFNIVQPDTYSANAAFTLVKIVPIEIPTRLPDLPKHERERYKEFSIVDNPTLSGTPARIFTETGIIEKGQQFYEYPKTIRVFFLLHEVGHFFYSTEEYCDLFALTHYLKMGYNRSMAFYALSKVLKRSENNMKRLHFLFTQIQKTQTTKL